MPSYFDSYSLCHIPHQSYKGHGSPVKSELVTFTLENSDGELATSWKPGETYTLITAVESGEDTQAFVHASIGVLKSNSKASSDGFQSKSCENAWVSLQTSKSHHMKWVAPSDVPTGGLCVVFSAAQATSSKAAYMTNSVRLLQVTCFAMQSYRRIPTCMQLKRSNSLCSAVCS